MYIKRHVEQVILDAAESFPCIVVYGPRQVGKSTTINIMCGQLPKDGGKVLINGIDIDSDPNGIKRSF